MTEFHDTPRTETLAASDVANSHDDVVVKPPALLRRQLFCLS
jgi:hypothetical protein